MRDRLTATLYPAGALALLLAAWWWASDRGVVPAFLLPAPGKVWTALIAGYGPDGALLANLLNTLQATLVGWVLGCGIAMALAALIAEFRIAERFLLWPLTAVQSIPKVSIAPLIFLWAGFGLQGKVVLVALICFFPVFAAGLVGFRAAEPNLLDLLRVHGASRWHRFRVVTLPAAAPFLFAGLEVAVSFALIGCVVMEFVGATRGMGFLIQDASNSFDLATVFAAILSLGLVGVGANWLVRRMHRRVVFWRREATAATAAQAAGG